MDEQEFLEHFGVLGMKWGKRKTVDSINTRDRTIKKGTEIQTITSRKFKVSDHHMYAAYTPYDKSMYIDTMGNQMYGEKGYKNSFVVKKDIRVPSDKQLVKSFIQLSKNNPEQVATDMASAHNALYIFSTRTSKRFAKKISTITDADSKKGSKLTKEYISLLVSNKTAKSRALFFGNLLKEGFDGMSDVNDRDQNSGTQDPLIIFNPPKNLGKVKSVKLTKKDLDYYYDLSMNKEFTKSIEDFSKVQR